MLPTKLDVVVALRRASRRRRRERVIYSKGEKKKKKKIAYRRSRLYVLDMVLCQRINNTQMRK